MTAVHLCALWNSCDRPHALILQSTVDTEIAIPKSDAREQQVYSIGSTPGGMSRNHHNTGAKHIDNALQSLQEASSSKEIGCQVCIEIGWAMSHVFALAI